MSLTTYRSTRTVQAMKINSVAINPDYSAVIGDEDGSTLQVSADYVLREKPKVGGFYMKNRDGFEAYIEKDVFEESFSVS
ncbi:hypothetical protein QMO12_03980 [Klebsiella pneumoniae]|uniref:hypothetical protein n=1 Tax=Klebsiella pneumoniae TaxID=573 RepID=UPI002B2549DB|nr:hypothetical protein [Klebsiella pneumoniae]MEB2368443.1 hypothetical protein [Klebsiella pneumoniae]